MNTLGLFLKQPLPGRVKTRLGVEIGHESAARLAEAFQRDLLERTAGLAERRLLACSPDTPESRAWFMQWQRAGDELWPQPETGLGERMSRYFEDSLKRGGPVVLIGSDSPTLPVELIRDAFAQLTSVDCVLGPAFDGGYCLVGQRTFLPEMFDNIDWSSPRVLTQTVARLAAAGRSLALLPPWYDVDGLDDLRFLSGHLDALELAGRTADIPPRTHRTVRAIMNSFSSTSP